MKLTNNEIYSYAGLLNQYFGPECTVKFPIKINFFLQKNIETLTNAAQEIEKARLKIAQDYGVLTEDGTGYSIPDDKLEEAQSQLNELFGLEQHLKIKRFSIEDFNNVELSTAETAALMFMIKDLDIEDDED